MPYELIITEKPAAMKKIADALADGKALKKNINGIAYYEVTHGKKDIVLTSAVGHLYTVTEKEKKGWTYPVFEVKWEQSSKINKASKFTSKYVTAIKKLAKGANVFTVATDFDIEGEVIGFNVLKYACKQKDAKRMKYSTLTKGELRKSYANASPHIEWGQANAGLTRHELDWYYGINLSRALSLAIKTTGRFKVLSSGRVQGPALKIVVDKEKEIQKFKPEPFWEIQLLGKIKTEEIEAWHKKGKIFEKEKADKIIQNTKNKKEGVIVDAKKKQFNQAQPTPFDLTTLQTEAFRVFKIPPKRTLELAQNLYLAGAISYPRTSSQELPKALGYKKLLEGLKKNEIYRVLVEKILKKSVLKPNNGKKKDPAHPAIYPTGIIPKAEERELKLYDLIVKRFIATFSDPAKRETATIDIDVNKEIFITKGTRTIEKGWHEYYAPYIKLEEQTLPEVNIGDVVKIKKISQLEKETKPPRRYSQASILKELEKRGLGTKATRAAIIDTLYNRGYVTGQPIEATKLGKHTIDTLEKYSPMIVDEELTKHFESEMNKIREKKKEGKDVLEEAKKVLTKTLTEFKKKEVEIGKELIDASNEAEAIANTVGKCPACKEGTLMIRFGKFGRFIACNKYPDCKTTFKLPAGGMIKPTDKVCEQCNHPMIKIIKTRSAKDVCINPDCKSKHPEGVSAEEIKELEKQEKKCSKCGKPMILRKSVYGQFWGCSGYPKCKTIEKVEKEANSK